MRRTGQKQHRYAVGVKIERAYPWPKLALQLLFVVIAWVVTLALSGCDTAPGVEPDGGSQAGPNSCQYANDGECDEGTYCAIGTDQNDCAQMEPTQASVSLSGRTPFPSQGKMILVDYEGPDFDEDDLRITVGNDPVDGLFLDDQISLLLPLSHQGLTTLTFDFGAGPSATLELNIGAAPTISNPQQYLSDELTKLTARLLGLANSDGAYQGVYDALIHAQSELADVGEQEMNLLAIVFKQNLEPALVSVQSYVTDHSSVARQSSSMSASTTRAQSEHEASCNEAMQDFVVDVGVAVYVVGTTATAVALIVKLAALNPPAAAVLAAAKVAAAIYVGYQAGQAVVPVWDHCVQALISSIRQDLTELSHGSVGQLNTQSGDRGTLLQASSLTTLRFEDGRSEALTIIVSHELSTAIRSEYIETVSKIRRALTKVKSLVGIVSTTLSASFEALLSRFPESVERTTAADARGFALKGISDRNIAGEIVSGSGTTLSVRFTFKDPLSVSMDYVDFDFVLANDEIGLDDTSVGAKLYRYRVTGGKMYWTTFGKKPETSRIERANLDGSERETLISTGRNRALDIAISGGKMYWTTHLPTRIERANLDGSGRDTLISNDLDAPYDIAISGGKMYWTGHWDSGGSDARIAWANLDGSERETLIRTGGGPFDIAISGGKMYWTTAVPTRIERANLDGSGRETLISIDLDSPNAIAISGGKMYWTTVVRSKIKRANLDGSGRETLISTESTGSRRNERNTIAISGGKMYWTDSAYGTIERANLDGSGRETLISTGLSRPSGIAIAPWP